MFEAGFRRGAALVEQGLVLFAGEDPGAIRPAELGDQIKPLRGFIDRLEVQAARRVERFDKDDLCSRHGDTSTTSWLRRNCKLSGGSADRRVRLARQLPELEATQKAVESGQIGLEHALEIARATEDMGSAAEAELLQAAQQKDPAELRQTARELRHRLDADGLPAQALVGAGHGPPGRAIARPY